jgi:uncharacterized protein
MTDDDQSPEHSPLEQSLTRDGKTVQIGINKDGEGGWILEVVDEHWNSTVWDEPFQSDREALNEALKTIDEEGIASLIGIHTDSLEFPQKPNPRQVMVPLSQDEMDELDNFLTSGARSENAMMLGCLDGFLTAIVTGPIMLKPSEWLPRVWGPTENDEPTFDTFPQAERITDLIMRHLNAIIWSLQQDPDTFEPLFDTFAYPGSSCEYTDGEMWAYGYMTGINLQRKNWKEFFDDPTSIETLRPIYLLGAFDEITPEDEELTKTPVQREELTEQIPASVAWIYRFWQPYRRAVAEQTIATSFHREHSEEGGNDPCPCGSEKKFKNCCGASTVLH